MKRQEHLAEVEEVAIQVRVENLKNGRYLGTSPDVPGLVAEGRSVAEMFLSLRWDASQDVYCPCILRCEVPIISISP